MRRSTTKNNGSSVKDDLTNRLASLLGFEEGASDVLEHLLSIESQEDLSDYLSQLLGLEENDDVNKFVKDVGCYQRGESLSSVAPPPSIETKPSSPQPNNHNYMPTTKDPKASSNHKKANSKLAKSSKLNERRGGRGNLKTKQQPPVSSTKKSSPQPQLSTSIEPAITSTSSNTAAAATLKETKKKQTVEEKTPKKLPPTPRGQASIICGCFGTKHKALANCLFCGRISCAKEGYDFCPFCGFLVEEIKVPEEQSKDAAAWLHKERLLNFDRDFAQRTIILDDQADYFSNKTSTWASTEEQEEAREKEEERRRNLHERKNQQLNIAF